MIVIVIMSITLPYFIR